MTKHIWNADTYAKFLTARTRPARDLLAAVPQGSLLSEWFAPHGGGRGLGRGLID